MGWWWSTRDPAGIRDCDSCQRSAGVLKYRLYDIDLVISRTLVYGGRWRRSSRPCLTQSIVVGIGTLVGSAGQPNLLLSIVATAILARPYQPVRERFEKIANRLVYGKRATPNESTRTVLGTGRRDVCAEDARKMARVLAEGTGADQAQVWIRTGTVLRPRSGLAPRRRARPRGLSRCWVIPARPPRRGVAVPVRPGATAQEP